MSKINYLTTYKQIVVVVEQQHRHAAALCSISYCKKSLDGANTVTTITKRLRLFGAARKFKNGLNDLLKV